MVSWFLMAFGVEPGGANCRNAMVRCTPPYGAARHFKTMTCGEITERLARIGLGKIGFGIGHRLSFCKGERASVIARCAIVK